MTIQIDNTLWRVARIHFGQDYFPRSTEALQALLEDYKNGVQNVTFDTNQDGELTADDILKYLGYTVTDVNVQVEGNLQVQSTFSNSRQVAMPLKFPTAPWGEQNTPGFAFQWASFQDEVLGATWDTLKTCRLHIPVLESPIAPSMDIYLIRA